MILCDNNDPHFTGGQAEAQGSKDLLEVTLLAVRELKFNPGLSDSSTNV